MQVVAERSVADTIRHMIDDPEALRGRALDCLNLSKGARSEADRSILEDIAAELNAAADKLVRRALEPVSSH